MATTGELLPTSASTSQVAVGDLAWNSVTQSYTNDGAGANVTAAAFDSNVLTQRLKLTKFVMPAGLSAGATINGVIARIEAWGTGSAIMTSCSLLGTDKAVSGNNVSGTSGGLGSGTTVVVSAGASIDQWGMALNPTLVGNANFGIGIRCKALANNRTVFIDYATLEIIYDLPTSANETNVKFVEC
jgi:hypothetical protein